VVEFHKTTSTIGSHCGICPRCQAPTSFGNSNDKILMVSSDGDMPPFLTFVSVTDGKLLGHYRYPAGQDGMEQPVRGEFLLKPRLACERAHDNGHANDTISRSRRR
jgi:hypothetical protein